MMFSVIIPAYQAEKTLVKCLESLESQTFQDFEVLIIDDGSTDRTKDAATPFAERDPRYHYVYKPNGGVSSARNHGMHIASGEFIVFLDSDDRYDPRYLEVLSEMISAHPDHDHFWCGYRTVDGSGALIGDCTFSSDQELHMSDRSMIMQLHKKSLDASPCNKAYRRAVIEAHGLAMRKDLSLGEDLLFNYAYLDVCRTGIVISNQPVYLYTKARSDSLDSRFRPDLKEIYDILDGEILRYLQKWMVPSEQLVDYYTSVFYRLEKVLDNTYRPENQMSALQKWRYNAQIIRGRKFQQALRHSNCTIHPVYKTIYKTGSWTLIQLLNGLYHLKRNFKVVAKQ